MPVCQVIWSKVLPKNSQEKQLDQSDQITACKFDKDISSEILLYPELSIGEKFIQILNLSISILTHGNK